MRPAPRIATRFGVSPVWALVLATLWLSLMPVEHIPSVFNFWDKAQHALGFSALAYFGLMGHTRLVRQVVLGLLAFGVAIEVTQHLSGWRHGDWQDWVADCFGVLIGYAAWTFYLRMGLSGRRS